MKRVEDFSSFRFEVILHSGHLNKIKAYDDRHSSFSNMEVVKDLERIFQRILTSARGRDLRRASEQTGQKQRKQRENRNKENDVVKRSQMRESIGRTFLSVECVASGDAQSPLEQTQPKLS